MFMLNFMLLLTFKKWEVFWEVGYAFFKERYLFLITKKKLKF